MTAVLSAVYVTYALLSSYIIGYVTHGVENFIVRSLVFVVLGSLTVEFGYCTIMGGVTGVLLELWISTPVGFYLFFSLLAYGVVFDVVINFHRDPLRLPSAARLLLGSILASGGMSVTALSVFTVVGFFPLTVLPLIWGVEIAIDITLGIIGAMIGVALVRRISPLKLDNI